MHTVCAIRVDNRAEEMLRIDESTKIEESYTHARTWLSSVKSIHTSEDVHTQIRSYMLNGRRRPEESLSYFPSRNRMARDVIVVVFIVVIVDVPLGL